MDEKVDESKMYVFEFGCAHGGGPWSATVEATEAEILSTFAGDNKLGEKKKVSCKAGVTIGDARYVMIVYSSRTGKDVERGEISISDFRKLLKKYRGIASEGQEKYVARLNSDGRPTSFWYKNDPFSIEFCI
jgi:hypothetical protein